MGNTRTEVGHRLYWILFNSLQQREELAMQQNRAMSLPSWLAELSGCAVGNEWLCELGLVIYSSAVVRRGRQEP